MYLINFKETGIFHRIFVAFSEYCINFITQYVLLVFEPNKVGIEKERMPVPITKKIWNPF